MREKSIPAYPNWLKNYLKVITRPRKPVNIIDMVEKLEQPNIDQQADLKEFFYKEFI